MFEKFIKKIKLPFSSISKPTAQKVSRERLREKETAAFKKASNKKRVANSVEMKNISDAEELKNYEANLKLLIKSNSDFMFPNWSRKHASIVLTYLIECTNPSTNEVLIYEPDLKGDISTEAFLTALDFFVEKGGIFKLVIKKDDHKKTNIYRLLEELSAKFPDNVFVNHDVTGSFRDSAAKVFDYPMYFAVGGNFIRVEKENPEIDYEAICNVNSKEISEKLKGVFNTHIHECLPIFNSRP